MAELDLEPAEEEAETEGASEKAVKGGRSAGIKVILMSVAVVGLLASNAFFMFRSTASAPQEESADDGEVSEDEIGDEARGAELDGATLIENGSVLRLEPLLVNLADEEENRFVRARVELVFESQDEMERIQNSPFGVAKAQDVALSLLATKRSQDLADLDGRARFREELVRALRENLTGVKVIDVLLTDFIIQY